LQRVKPVTDLIRELDKLRRRAHRSAEDNAAVLKDIGCFYHDHIKLVVGPVLGVEALYQL
jgi:hypothetical protein